MWTLNKKAQNKRIENGQWFFRIAVDNFIDFYYIVDRYEKDNSINNSIILARVF